VITRTSGGEASSFIFSDYSAFAKGQLAEPSNMAPDLSEATETQFFSDRLLRDASSTGTQIRIQVVEPQHSNLLGHTLANYSTEKFANLLQLYTPIGQVNDYVFHPAYHTLRKGDLVVDLTSLHAAGGRESRRVDFDFFRLSGHVAPSHYDFSSYVNAAWPRGKSVHTVHRERSGDYIHLSAADVQAAEEIHKLEERLRERNELPTYINETDKEVAEIPRGFQAALSGGMRSEYVARPPRSTGAAFRGIILAETARPTLGRKHVMDQRTAIARAAQAHERVYDDLRKAVLPTAEPPPTTPAAARWRREFHQAVVSSLGSQEPLTDSLGVWAGEESREARVMLTFGALLSHGAFGELRVLRAHLKDIYDFAFYYRAEIAEGMIPSRQIADRLQAGGYAEIQSGHFLRYGIGEFKAYGEDLFEDFDDLEPRKMPDTPDLLVCWSFEQAVVEDGPWVVEGVSEMTQEFPGQTHLWIPQRGEIRRERPLPVVSLATLISQRVATGDLQGAPQPWPDVLPNVYY
jgi:hypothetical protein